MLRTSLLELESRWRAVLNPRRNSAADKLLPLLIANPVVSPDDVARLTGVSSSAAYLAIEQVIAADILTPVSGSTRNRLFEAKSVYQVLTDYERASATMLGDTRVEKPRRPVPYREDQRKQPDGRDRGASAVEYGLLVAGITAAFLIGALGLQAVVGEVLDQAVTSVEQDDPPPARTP